MNDDSVPAGTGQITVYLGTNVVHTFSLTMPVLTVGRLPDNTLPLADDPMVSRHHAELRVTPEGVVLTDLGSGNGTIVGGARIPAHQPYLLASGTVFYIGSYGFVYDVVGQSQPEPAVAEPEPAAAESEPEPAAVEPEPEPAADDGAGGDAPAITPPVEPLAAEPLPIEPLPAEPMPVEPAAVLPEPAPPLRSAEAAENQVALPPPAPPPPPRPTWEAPSPPGPLSSYLRDLPSIFQDNDFLGRYLMILESIWEPIEHRQDHIEFYFDPRTCPPPFLAWLATWLDPALETHWPEERQRAVVSRALDLYRWRGTRYGLARIIELCTGLAPRITEDPAMPFCFRIRLEVPPDGGVDRRLVEQLIAAQKPAHTGYVLEVAVLS